MVRLAKFGYLLAILLIVAMSGELALAQSKAGRKQHSFHPQGVQGEGADWMAPLFGTQRRFRDVTGTGIEQMNELDKTQGQIMDEFNTLDPTRPTRRRVRRR